MSQLTVQQALSILQLRPGASHKQIRAAYKRLALKLHPDKHQKHPRPQQQQQQQPQQQDAGSIALPADPAAAFSLLSAAYELLSGTHHQPANSSSINTWPSFEAAYASGSLFTDALVDQALLAGLPPADVAALQQLASAAASGQLAAQLAQHPPSQAEEQQWRQLYRQLTINWQLQQLQQQQQQQHNSETSRGVCLVELLSDLLLKPHGQVMVELSDDEEQQQQQQQQQQQHLSCAGPQQHRQSKGSCIAVTADSRDHSHAQQQLDGASSCTAQDDRAAATATCSSQHAQQTQDHLQPTPCKEHTQQVHSKLQQATQQATQQQQQQQQQECVDGRGKRERHGLGFYWMWLRRLLLARAVLSILTSKQRGNYDANLLAVL
jgi:hypothetical protein